MKTTALLIWILFLDWKCIFSIVLSCCCCGCSAESRGCFPQGKASPGFGSHCIMVSSPIWRSNFIFIHHESNTTMTTNRHAGNFQNLVGASLHCCRLQVVYSPITVKIFVTVYRGSPTSTVSTRVRITEASLADCV